MRPQTKWQIPALVLSIALPLTTFAADQDVRAQELDAILSRAVAPGQPGIAVLVKKAGIVLFEKGYGLTKSKGSRPITPETDFRLASVTKQFTAMTVMLLVRDGKLRYDSALTEVFPEFPEYGEAITVRHLLTHTAGLPDYEDLMDRAEKSGGKRWSPEHQIQDEEVLELLEKETRGKFAPGASWAYSNSAYVVLGLIVAISCSKKEINAGPSGTISPSTIARAVSPPASYATFQITNVFSGKLLEVRGDSTLMHAQSNPANVQQYASAGSGQGCRKSGSRVGATHREGSGDRSFARGRKEYGDDATLIGGQRWWAIVGLHEISAGGYQVRVEGVAVASEFNGLRGAGCAERDCSEIHN